MVAALYNQRSVSGTIKALKDGGALSEPLRLLVLAESCFHAGATSEALGYVARLERFQRFQVHARVLKVRMLLREGAVAEADALMDDLVAERGGAAIPPDLANSVARRMIAQGSRAEAISFLQQVGDAGNLELVSLHVSLLAHARRFEMAEALIAQGFRRLGRDERGPLWLMLGRIRAMMGEFERAKVCLAQGLAKSPVTTWKDFYRGARIAERGGFLIAAHRWSTEALRATPQSSATVSLAARIRLAAENYDGAILLLRGSLARQYVPMHHFMLARALLGAGKIDTALAELKELVDLHPSHFAGRVLLARLFLQLERLNEAATEIDELVEDAPDHPDVLPLVAVIDDRLGRHRTGSGKSGAVVTLRRPVRSSAASGFREDQVDLILDDPDVRAALERPTPRMFRPQWTEADLRAKGNFLAALGSMATVIWVLLVRETRTRFAESKLGYVWALVEPSIYIGMLVVVWLMMGAHYLNGMSITLFIITGFIPFSFFSSVYAKLIGLIHSSAALLFHPQIKPMDIALARGILEFATLLIIFGLFLTGVALSGERVRISNPLEVLTCLLLLWCSGFGMALLVEAVSREVSWARIVGGALVRKLFFSSGIFWTPQMLPGWVLKIFLWNPILHLVTLTRSNFSPLVWRDHLSLTYAACCALFLLLLGLMANLSLREKVLAR
jgi:capsular polysaccharide transport system permease protein